jgi:hypothetical protein
MLVAISLAWTSYITIFRPSVDLYIEIIEEDKPLYRGITGFLLWTMLAIPMAPWIAYILLTADNEEAIRNFASTLAEKTENDE